jgi:hypothetical protein
MMHSPRSYQLSSWAPIHTVPYGAAHDAVHRQAGAFHDAGLLHIELALAVHGGAPLRREEKAADGLVLGLRSAGPGTQQGCRQQRNGQAGAPADPWRRLLADPFVGHGVASPRGGGKILVIAQAPAFCSRIVIQSSTQSAFNWGPDEVLPPRPVRSTLQRSGRK